MTWRIEFARSAEVSLGKLDRQIARRILRFLHDRVALLEDPRASGVPLSGPELGRFWKYRVGDYRVVCEILDERLVLVVVRVGHRRAVYR